MHEERPPDGPTGIAIRRQSIGLRLTRQLNQLRYASHKRFSPAEPPHPKWISYASQQHVRDIDVDNHRGRIWLATWGGVLCWIPEADICVRYTSEHGLAGNATRAIVVDLAGTVWAACQEGGLASLTLETRTGWQLRQDLQYWTVLCLVSHPQAGIYAALRDAEGSCALCEITSPDARLRWIKKGGLPSKNVEVMLVDDEDSLWIGNAWGLHCQKADGSINSFGLGGLQVSALATSVDGGLWVGTNKGIYHFQIDKDDLDPQMAKWPQDEVMSVVVEQGTGKVWVATTREVGCIVNHVWQPVHNGPTGLLKVLATVREDIRAHSFSLRSRFRESRVLAGGANGLYSVGIDSCELILSLADEDTLSNAIHCLLASEEDIWLGTARGLYRFDGRTWRCYDLSDVRTLLYRREQGWLWVGTWRTGLQYIKSNEYVPSQSFTKPVISLTSTDETLWVATPEAVYGRYGTSQQWKAVPYPARKSSDAIVVQTICYQEAQEANGEIIDVLWVGTSAGLFYYLPDLNLSGWASDDLQRCSIHALAVDPVTNCLWVGASAGLFSEHFWQRQLEGCVRALAFDAEGTLWLATTEGLEHWSVPEHGQVFSGHPLARFTITDSGLAARAVTALATRVVGNEREVLAGSSAGMNCYRYQPRIYVSEHEA